jgi:N-acetyltransferase
MHTPRPVTLERSGVRLEPMRAEHAQDLAAAAADGELWKLVFTSVPAPGDEAAYIASALQGLADGHMLPFVVREVASGRVIGSTRYHDIVVPAQRVEIGYTWYASSTQRTAVNTLCKLQLMTHAFDTLDARVVGWRTDILNTRSQAAIERLGALEDGVIRHHAPRRDGSVRDTVIYSMLRDEWPACRARLEARLAQG